MRESEHHKVIIVGAGIAGLTAAWQLKKAGIEALVLEADEKVGGRMQSIQIEDALIDSGAQFLSNVYSIIPELIKETGLNNQFVTTTHERVGLVRDKKIFIIHPRRPWDLVASRLLSFWSMLRLGFNQCRLFSFSPKSVLNDVTAWTSYDNQSAKDWVENYFGEAVMRELTSTIFNGFYFQSLENSSAALAAAVISFSDYKPRTMTLTTGMGSLPQKLAEKLNVRTGVCVSSILETSTGVKVISDSGEFNAEHVIVTVPAPIAKKMIQHPDDNTSALFETPYSSSALVSLLTHNNWTPPSNIASAYGFLFNPHWESKVAALTIENNKCVTRKKEGYLINVMLSNNYAKQIQHLTDEEIYAAIQSDIEIVFPLIYQHLHLKKICRWQFAMPCTPIGRATAVKQYRESRRLNNRVWLAGDYLGFPWTDSAAQTGLWAANQVSKFFK